jgi:hypothetical protein
MNSYSLARWTWILLAIFALCLALFGTTARAQSQLKLPDMDDPDTLMAILAREHDEGDLW